MDRPITPHEAAVLRWLLDRAPVGDAAHYRTQPLEELRVVPGCDCGCSSLRFREHHGREHMLADALAVYPDGQQAGLILWGCDGGLLWLEVYDCHPDASHRFPEIANLRTFEERGRELP